MQLILFINIFKIKHDFYTQKNSDHGYATLIESGDADSDFRVV